MGRAWRGAARRGAVAVYTRARLLVPGTTPCRHHLSEDKLLRPLEIRLGVEGVGVDAYLVQPGPLQRGRPLNVSSRTTYGDPPEPEVVLPCTCISATDLRRSIVPIGSRRVVHRGSRHESTPVFRERSLSRCALLFFPSPPPFLPLSRRFLASQSSIYAMTLSHQPEKVEEAAPSWDTSTCEARKREEEKEEEEGGRKRVVENRNHRGNVENTRTLAGTHVETSSAAGIAGALSACIFGE